MLKRGKTYREVYDSLRWEIPEYYNIGVDICDKHARRGNHPALIYEDEKGGVERYSFKDLRNLSNKLANALRARGVGREDRVGILLSQCPEAAISHIAIYKLGAIAIPLFTLFGTDAREYRLADSEAKGIVVDGANLHKILEIRERLPRLEVIVVTKGEKIEGTADFWDLIDKGSSLFNPVRTRANDPALIIYTSGTTGPPKGALHAQRVVLGHVPGVEFPQNLFPREGDFFWTPADWAWIGGLIDALLPSWHHGVPVLAHRARKFDPEHSFHLIAKHRVRNAFIPPTGLKIMRQVKDPRSRYDCRLRSVASGGETLGEELLAWGREAMGLTINEFYGQTEANLVVGNCAEVMDVKPGSMGRPVPGHTLAVVAEDGSICPTGEVGEVAVKRPDPVMFLEYWRDPQATKDKFSGDWCLTGDLARKDDDGYYWFVGRKDDVIISAGYRIGPAEIEDCILKHPAVSMVAVIGSPDEVRGEIVKAFVVPKPGVTPGNALADDIREFVRVRLAAHEYPREVEFLEELPLTATSKVKRKDLRQMEMERKLGRKD